MGCRSCIPSTTTTTTSEVRARQLAARRGRRGFGRIWNLSFSIGVRLIFNVLAYVRYHSQQCYRPFGPAKPSFMKVVLIRTTIAWYSLP